MTDHEPRDLDTLLSESSPATSEHGPLRTAALEAMAHDAPPSRRHVRRPLFVGAGAMTLVLAGGIAASAAFDWQSWWAEDAVAEVSYTLPSGALCTGIIGNFAGADEAVAAAEAFMAQPGMFDSLDIEAAYAQLQHDFRAQGGEISDDQIYVDAVGVATWQALVVSLESQGVDYDGMEWEGESSCPGGDLPWNDVGAPGE